VTCQQSRRIYTRARSTHTGVGGRSPGSASAMTALLSGYGSTPSQPPSSPSMRSGSVGAFDDVRVLGAAEAADIDRTRAYHQIVPFRPAGRNAAVGSVAVTEP
jgi:hypothetical protein